MSSDYKVPDRSTLFARGETLCDGRFSVLKYVGVGSIASGWRCEDTLLRERIVCKIAHSEKDNEHLRLQYLKLHQLRSDGIARVHGLFIHDRLGVIALEAIEGEDFSVWLPRANLNEKFNALIQIASALGELHEQGIYHGDFKGGTNIRNHKKRGCVFIDPEPHTPGSLSTIAGDLSDLAELIELLLPDYASRYFEKTLQRLKSNDYTANDAAVDLTAVRDSRHLPGNLDQIKLDAANYSAKRAKTDQQYKWNRENRAAAIERLKENIDAIARHYPGLTTTLHPFDANREMENDTAGRGHFLGRSVQCRDSGADHTFSVNFDQSQGFKRPWPHGASNLIAKGKWFVGYGANEQTGLIEVRIDDRIPKIYVSDGELRNSESTHKVRLRPQNELEKRGLVVDESEAAIPPQLRLLDDTWLQERIRELTADP